MHPYFTGLTAVIVYFVIAASTALLCRWRIRIPDALFRKTLHCILLFSLLAFVYGFSCWWHAAATVVGFAAVVYPLLALLERHPGFSRLTTERSHGELKQSLLLVFGMFAGVISVCWGLLGDRLLVLASVYAWGFGDAAAALVGKRFGKHRIPWHLADNHKTYEGSAAMAAVAFVSVLLILALRGGLGLGWLVAVSLVTALVSALAELCSKGGMDTVICPVGAMAALIGMLYVAGGL